MTLRPCPICNAPASTKLEDYSRDHWSVEQCTGCGHVYLKNPPGYGALEQDFAWEKTYVTEHERRLDESPVAYRLDVATRFRHTWFRKSTQDKYRAWFGGGNVLDVGCSEGNDRIDGFTFSASKSQKTWPNRPMPTCAAKADFASLAPVPPRSANLNPIFSMAS